MRSRAWAGQRRRHRRRADEASGPSPAAIAPHAPMSPRGAYYAAGPSLRLSPAREHETPEAGALAMRSRGEIEAETGLPGASPLAGPELETIPAVSGTGPADEAIDYGKVKLQGLTDAHFDGGAFSIENIVAAKGTGCKGCAANKCVHVQGDLVVAYTVTTTVSLPSAADFPGLTPCQVKIVQDAIDTVLAAHEQQHVHAFSAYNGTTRTPFDLTLCRASYDDAVKDMFTSQEGARRKAAKDASAALDPFSFDVDPKCDEPPVVKPKP